MRFARFATSPLFCVWRSRTYRSFSSAPCASDMRSSFGSLQMPSFFLVSLLAKKCFFSILLSGSSPPFSAISSSLMTFASFFSSFSFSHFILTSLAFASLIGCILKNSFRSYILCAKSTRSARVGQYIDRWSSHPQHVQSFVQGFSLPTW